MKQFLSILLITFFSITNSSASGWNDYSLDIGGRYNILKMNSLEVCLGKENSHFLICPHVYETVGPIVKYILTSKYIFTKNLGRKNRNLFEGDTFEDIDPAKEFFFIVVKENDKVIGPLSEKEFSKRDEVVSQSKLDWQTPNNPNFLLPLFGSIIFLVISIPILLVKFYWITIPTVVGIIMLVKYMRKRKKKKAKKLSEFKADGTPNET